MKVEPHFTGNSFNVVQYKVSNIKVGCNGFQRSDS